MKFLKVNLFTAVLFLIFLLSFFIRIIGVNPGYPPNHPDEPIIYGTVMKMLLNKELDPFTIGSYRFQYPGLAIYLHFFLYAFFFFPLMFLKSALFHPYAFLSNIDHMNHFISEFVIGKRGINVLFWGRYTTVIIGSLSIPLVFFVGKQLFNKYVGLVAALFLAVNFRHIISSQLGLVDGPNSTFALLSLYLSLRLLSSPTRKNYVFAGLGVALSLATKLYFFSLLPFLLSHFLLSIRKKRTKEIAKFLLSPNFFASIAVIIFVFLLLNPFLPKHLFLAIHTQTLNNLRYGMGSNTLITTPFWYLWDIGIGSVPFSLALVGLIISIINKKYILKALYILFFIIPPFFLLLYYSNGGAYVRNFTSVIPFIYLFSAVGLVGIFNFAVRKKLMGKKATYLILLIITAFIINYSNIKNSLMMDFWGIKPWNQTCMENWLNNAQKGTKIVRFTNVPLVRTQKLKYIEVYTNNYADRTPFSLPELQESSYADYLAIDYSINQSYFLWWVGGNTYRKMPVKILDNTFEGLVFKEFSRYSILDCKKPWPAIDHNYAIVKIPNKKGHKNIKLYRNYTLDKNGESQDKSCRTNTCLAVKSKGRSAEPEWIVLSDLIPVEAGKNYIVKGWIKSKKYLPPTERDGFLRIDFYKDGNIKNRRGIIASVSPRYYGEGWEEKETQAVAPIGANYMVISFQEQDFMTDFYIDDLKVYIFEDKPDSQEIRAANTREVDDLILYPTSIL